MSDDKDGTLSAIVSGRQARTSADLVGGMGMLPAEDSATTGQGATPTRPPPGRGRVRAWPRRKADQYVAMVWRVQPGQT
jgi:hypothetical protein